MIENNNQFASYIESIKRSFRFAIDYPRIVNALKNYPTSFATSIIFYVYNNKILLNEVLSYLPRIDFVEMETSYIEELSKIYNIDVNNFTMGSVLAFFTAVEKGSEINEKTYINQSWCYNILLNNNGAEITVYEPYPFSKKEYAISVTFNKLSMEFNKLMDERLLVFSRENNLQKTKQENDQVKRMVLMKQINISARDIKFLDFSILMNEKALLKTQERRIILDYKLAGNNCKTKTTSGEIRQIRMIRGKQLYLYHQLMANDDFDGFWKMKCELENYNPEFEEKDSIIKHI